MTSGRVLDAPGCTVAGKLSLAGPSYSTVPFGAYQRYHTRSSMPVLFLQGTVLVLVTVTVGQ